MQTSYIDTYDKCFSKSLNFNFNKFNIVYLNYRQNDDSIIEILPCKIFNVSMVHIFVWDS